MSNTNARSGADGDALAAEVERIKRDVPFNGSYREQIAALLASLFFKFGERPGANRVSALLAENGRSPSTTTAQDEINKFWDTVRKNATITIDRPDVPASLLTLLSDFAGQAWQQCMAEAQARFDAHRQEATAEVLAARATAEQAQGHVTQARVAAAQTLRDLQVANESREGLSRQVAREVSKGEELRKQIEELTGRLAQEKAERARESKQTQDALAALKEAQDVAVDEQRRLMTIGDEFKQQAARERAARTKLEAAQEALTAENAELKKQLALLAHQRGVLEGANTSQASQIETLTLQLAQSRNNQVSPPKKRFRPALKNTRPR
jgi:hypothetical protein